MPAAQGVLKWPTGAAGAGDPDRRDSRCRCRMRAVDRVLMVRALEMSDDPERLLREIWRVLAPSGRLIAVIPNRRGVWTRTDHTPFGHGRPYSRAQIGGSCCGRPGSRRPAWGGRCSCRRWQGSWFLRSAMAWEQVGAALSMPFAGTCISSRPASRSIARSRAKRERARLIPRCSRCWCRHRLPRRATRRIPTGNAASRRHQPRKHETSTET